MLAQLQTLKEKVELFEKHSEQRDRAVITAVNKLDASVDRLTDVLDTWERNQGQLIKLYMKYSFWALVMISLAFFGKELTEAYQGYMSAAHPQGQATK